MKYCKFCGNELPENGICNCADAQASATTESAAISNPLSKKNTSLIIGVIAVVALIAIVISLIGSIFSGGYKKPIDNFFKGLDKCSVKTMAKAFPEDMAYDLKEETDDEDLESMISLLEAFYGEKLKISYDIEDKEKLDKDDIEELEDSTDLKIKKAYEVTITLEIKGKKEEAEEETSLVVAKVKGEGWKLVSDAMSSVF